MTNTGNDIDYLLTEYSVCGQHVATLDAAIWQSASILLGASFAVMGVLSLQNATGAFVIGVSIAGSGAIVIILLWSRIWVRHTASIKNLHVRMREIEWMLGSRKNIYMQILGNWPKRRDLEEWARLSDEEREALTTKYKPLPDIGPRPALYITALIAVLGWIALPIGKWLEFVLQ